tara:strand:- start:1993 stop:3462 length:1470 start_codon:yes stop_codon:yes gene_type:complete
MTKYILCFSRSYLSSFLPQLAALGDEFTPLHIVQNSAEQRRIEATNQQVVMNLETLSKKALRDPDAPLWREPDDMRTLTGFDWSPIYADRYLPTFPEPDRLKIAGAIQTRLEQIFAEFRVSGVLSEPVALFPTHYLFYLCKRTGAKSLLWANTYFPGYFYFTDAVHLTHPSHPAPKPVSTGNAPGQAIRTYVERVAADKAGPVYHHKFARERQGSLNYLRQRRGEDALILTPGLASQAMQFARYMRARTIRTLFPRIGDYMIAGAADEHWFYLRNLLGRISRYDTPTSQFDRGNVFFPLQYEPEASLLYAAPDFRNQISLVETILQTLPAGHTLWVKEHPNQFGVLSRGVWRKLRKRYHNLRLVYGRENGRHLIQQCGLAVTITSTAGMDALILGRKCLVLGDVFFESFPDAIQVKSNAALAQALNDPDNYRNENHAGDLDGIADALRTFAASCYPGDPQPAPELMNPENMRALYDAVNAHLASDPVSG